MDPISGPERLAALLRQRLLERARTAEKKAQGYGSRATAMDLIYAAEPVAPQDARQRRRTVIQAILAEELGDGLLNEAEFQQLVDRVLGAIESDDAAVALLGRVMNDVSNVR
jgi:hypothetical protein